MAAQAHRQRHVEGEVEGPREQSGEASAIRQHGVPRGGRRQRSKRFGIGPAPAEIEVGDRAAGRAQHRVGGFAADHEQAQVAGPAVERRLRHPLLDMRVLREDGVDERHGLGPAIAPHPVGMVQHAAARAGHVLGRGLRDDAVAGKCERGDAGGAGAEARLDEDAGHPGRAHRIPQRLERGGRRQRPRHGQALGGHRGVAGPLVVEQGDRLRLVGHGDARRDGPAGEPERGGKPALKSVVGAQPRRPTGLIFKIVRPAEAQQRPADARRVAGRVDAQQPASLGEQGSEPVRRRDEVGIVEHPRGRVSGPDQGGTEPLRALVARDPEDDARTNPVRIVRGAGRPGGAHHSETAMLR